MELMEAIYNRRAVRDYTDKQMPRLAVIELINAAVQAPSAINQQPWAFAVFQGRQRLKDYSDRAKAHLLATLDRGSDLHGLRDMLADTNYNIFYSAGTLLVICAKPDGLNPAEDCCLAAQNLMLAAHGMGLGTCPIGFARSWLNLTEVKQELEIPLNYAAVFPVIVGCPAKVTASVTRRQPEIVSWK